MIERCMWVYTGVKTPHRITICLGSWLHGRFKVWETSFDSTDMIQEQFPPIYLILLFLSRINLWHSRELYLSLHSNGRCPVSRFGGFTASCLATETPSIQLLMEVSTMVALLASESGCCEEAVNPHSKKFLLVLSNFQLKIIFVFT